MKKYPNEYFRDKNCRNCEGIFTPVAPSQIYCGPTCAELGGRDTYLKRKYGISLKFYNNLLEEQDNRCKICLGEGFLMAEHHRMKLVVDHCHTNGNVRGLLCHNCNRALGLLKDDQETLLRGVEYLKEGSETIRKEYAQVSGSPQPLEKG